MSTQSQAPSSLVIKLCKVMAEIDSLAKAGHNDFHNYDYVKEADLLGTLRQKLAAQSIFVFTTVEDTTIEDKVNEKGKTIRFTTARVILTFVDGETGQERSVSFTGQGEDATDKGAYKAYTGAVKHALMKNFLVAADNDDNRGAQRSSQKEPTQSDSQPRSSQPSGSASGTPPQQSPAQKDRATGNDQNRRALWAELQKIAIPDATAREWVRLLWAENPKSGGELVLDTKDIPAWFFPKLTRGIAQGTITVDGITTYVREHAPQSATNNGGSYAGYCGPGLEKQEAS